MEPYEIIMSPFEAWLAPVGTAFPAINATPSGDWAKLGTNGNKNMTEDGITLTHSQTINQKRVYGATGAVKANRSAEDLTIAFTLDDLSLEQYAKVLNNVSVSDVAAASGTAGYRTITLRQGFDVATFALLLRGASPYGDSWNMQYQVPKVYQSESPAPAFGKTDAAGLNLVFTALEDPDAATDAERFGTCMAQDADALA
jgi:hypothetical protein